MTLDATLKQQRRMDAIAATLDAGDQYLHEGAYFTYAEKAVPKVPNHLHWVWCLGGRTSAANSWESELVEAKTLDAALDAAEYYLARDATVEPLVDEAADHLAYHRE